MILDTPHDNLCEFYSFIQEKPLKFFVKTLKFHVFLRKKSVFLLYIQGYEHIFDFIFKHLNILLPPTSGNGGDFFYLQFKNRFN